MNADILSLLAAAIDARADLFDARHTTAFRLFNGFYEGCLDWAIDLYARTIVLHNYADPPDSVRPAPGELSAYLLERLPWLHAIVLKTRSAEDQAQRRGIVLHGEKPDTRVRDPRGNVWYAIDMTLSRDAGLYLDTRDVRAWAIRHLAGKRVINTFAYTGSLGVAAMAGGAARVVQTDLKRAFLNVAKTSYTLNGFPIDKADFIASDFFPAIARLKRAGARFDCVFVDPPFFSITDKGAIDLARESHRAINKVRPLIEDGGYLVAINNALFLSGADYLRTLESLCADGYLSIEELIPVPPDFTGYPGTRLSGPPLDPSPFNHPTKIAVLRIRRKDARST